jgi:hypothetical protein
LPLVAAGVDPKSVVCEFFRHGRCDKGFKCKYSHDLSVERKTAKIDLFTDQRDVAKEGEEVRGSSSRSHQQHPTAAAAADCEADVVMWCVLAPAAWLVMHDIAILLLHLH